LDGEFASVKSTATRLDQRVEALQSNADRLSESIKILNETTLKMSSEISTLRKTLQTELDTVARPADINAAVTPYKDRIAALEGSLKTFEKIEAERAAQARGVVLSLELANLQRTVNTGAAYAEELNKVKAAAQGQVKLDELERYATTGAPTLATLQESFRPLIYKIVQASQPDQPTSLLGRFVDQAKSVVQVRRVEHDADDTSVEAIVARMESALRSGKLGTVVAHAKNLPPPNAEPAQPWLKQVKARTSVDTAMQSLEANLKSSLSKTSLTPTR
ncbi:MAG: hypothetical protein K0U34_05835, partial [Alphaproteobacteria bacterium]|nr:hypothetical protein [Alphaproteobacteria bacterium]